MTFTTLAAPMLINKNQKQFTEIFCYVPIYKYGGWTTYIEKTKEEDDKNLLFFNDVLEREEYFSEYRF